MSVTALAVRHLIVAGLILGGAGSAANAQTLSLTPEEKAQVLSQNTEASVDAARAGYVDGALPGSARPGIHGEVGAMIGSNGTRGAYGTAAIPLGENAGATVSFEDSRYGYGRVR